MTPTTLNTVDELVRQIGWVNEVETWDDKVARLSTFCLELDNSAFLTLDPFSNEYADQVLRRYTEISGREYDSARDEANPLDIDEFKQSNYPFLTRSRALVGDHFATIGTIIHQFPVGPGSRILEMGSGAGNLAVMMASTGYEITAYDIEHRYLEVLRHWAERMNVADRIKTVQGEFDQVDARVADVYDCIIFFSSFHHSLNHLEVLRKVLRKLKPDGCVLFAGEPIEEDFPVPWGLRTDSLSAYCIRQNGWLELGYRENYFLEVLRRSGFYAERRRYTGIIAAASGYVARPYRGRVSLNAIHLGSDYADEWHVPETIDFRWTKGNARIPLPEIPLVSLSVTISNYSPGPLALRVCLEDRGQILAGQTHQIPSGATQDIPVAARPASHLSLMCDPWCPADHGASDTRQLGIAVHHVDIGTDETAAPHLG